MKHLYIIISALLITALAALNQSCIDDKGNYDYVEISTAVIDGNNATESVDVSMSERLYISPVITYTEGTGAGDYTYLWYLCNNAFVSKKSLLSTSVESPVLNRTLPSSMSTANTYNVLFVARNNQTGVDYIKRYYVNVSGGNMTVGYLAISEKTDGMDLDIVAQYNDTLTLYTGILEFTESAYPREGRKPINIVTFPDNYAPTPYDTNSKRTKYSVFLLTDQGTDRLKAEDYSYLEDDYNIRRVSLIPSRFISETGLIAEKLEAKPAGNLYYVYIDRNWFFANMSGMFYFLETPINIINSDYAAGTKYYNAAPYIFNSEYVTLLYDTDNHRFTLQRKTSDWTAAAVLSTRVLSDGDGDLYNFNDKNYDLVYMSARNVNAATRTGFAVMKHIATGAHELWTFASAGSTGTITKTGRNVFPSSINVDQMKFFVYHHTQPYLYCAGEDNFYVVATSTMTVTDLTSSVIPSGHKISMFRTFWPRITTRSLFACATYDPSKELDTCGTLKMYSVDDYSGALSLANHPVAPTAAGYQIPMEWDGLGKVVGLDYKQQ